MNFSEALILLKQGRRVKREVWTRFDYGDKYICINQLMDGSSYFEIIHFDGSVGMWACPYYDILAIDWIVVDH